MDTTYPFSSFYHAAYGVTAAIYLGYAVSLWRRGRALRDRTPPR